MSNLNQFRKKIDSIDQQLLQLLSERAYIAIKVGKKKSIKNSNPSYMRHDREAQILKKICQKNTGPLSNNALNIIYKEIISSCRTLESPTNVSYLGPEGTYSELAAQRYFGQDSGINYHLMNDIQSVFEAVETKTTEFGIVPIENSYEGAVHQTIDGLIETKNTRICGEIELAIKHNFMSLSSDFSQIKTLYTHVQTYSQCSKWINFNNRDWEVKYVESNGKAASLAAQNKNSATIASVKASHDFLLNILEPNIQNQNNNSTRFIVLGQDSVTATSDDRCSLICSLGNQPGSLNKVLQLFAKNNINMTQILSRPARTNHWEYLFFIDVSGHHDQSPLKECITEIKDQISMLRVLGSYPKGNGIIE